MFLYGGREKFFGRCDDWQTILSSSPIVDGMICSRPIWLWFSVVCNVEPMWNVKTTSNDLLICSQLELHPRRLLWGSIPPPGHKQQRVLLMENHHVCGVNRVRVGYTDWQILTVEATHIQWEESSSLHFGRAESPVFIYSDEKEGSNFSKSKS